MKLQLDNNIIEKIENINFLKNLMWLDLSFNNITVIEGLDGLTKLVDLTLFNNRITHIQGLDDLHDLQVLSIGNNSITMLEEVSKIKKLQYLIKFEKLQVMNLSGNPISKVQDYRNYCLAHFKNLKYLDYRLIDEESFQIARARFIDSVIAMEEEEKVEEAKKAAIKFQQEVDARNEVKFN